MGGKKREENFWLMAFLQVLQRSISSRHCFDLLYASTGLVILRKAPFLLWQNEQQAFPTHSFLSLSSASWVKRKYLFPEIPEKKNVHIHVHWQWSYTGQTFIHSTDACQFLFDVSSCFQSYFCLFVMGSHYIALASLEHTEILLSLSPKCLDLKFVFNILLAYTKYT